MGKGTRFDTCARHWYQLSVRTNNWSPAQQKKILSIVETKLLPRFADMKLGDFTTADISSFRDDLLAGRAEGQKKPLSVASVESIMVPLRKIFDLAQINSKDAFHLENPSSKLKPLEQPKPGSKLEPLTAEEVELFLKEVDSRFYEYFILRFFAGLTAGEADGLMWRNIVINKNKVSGTIDLTHTASRGIRQKMPASTRRTLDLSELNPRVYEAILQLMNNAKENGGYGPESYVFTNSAGNALDHTNTNKRIWHPTLKKAGIEKRAALQTRATACVFWLQEGRPLQWIVAAMGYQDDRMLRKAYADYLEDR